MQPFFAYITDVAWDGTIENGICVYSQTDYQHGFFLMLCFAALTIAESLRLRQIYCRNISVTTVKRQ
ncbi:MAG: hypothetical protein WBB19_08395 [Desulforhopalus sp.]